MERLQIQAPAAQTACDVSIVMPCLNEARSIPICIANAKAALAEMQSKLGLSGEILIADNGSEDGSQRLASATGVLISAYSVAAALSAWHLGRLTRHRSPVGLLLLTLVGGALVVAPMALVPRFGPFLGLAVLLGLVAGGSLTLCYTIGGLMVPAAVRTTAFGFFSGAALFGGAISPAVAGLVAQLSLRSIYWVDAALYLALAAALARPAALRLPDRTTSPPAPA